MQLPDAELLCRQLCEQMRPHVTPATVLVGIHTGGVWLAERLRAELALPAPLGTIDVSFYRDDFGTKGLHTSPQHTRLSFSVEGSPVILVDDVLYTGRTTRAAINELFDFGRPARVDLAVLIDRGERELPIAAQYCALKLREPLPAGKNLRLEREDNGLLTLRLIDVEA